MMVRDLRKWCDEQEDTDVVRFSVLEGTYGNTREREYENVTLKTRKPSRIEFTHEECECFEVADFKGEKRRYCNLKERFLKDIKEDGLNAFHTIHSCPKFKPKDYDGTFSH